MKTIDDVESGLVRIWLPKSHRRLLDGPVSDGRFWAVANQNDLPWSSDCWAITFEQCRKWMQSAWFQEINSHGMPLYDWMPWDIGNEHQLPKAKRQECAEFDIHGDVFTTSVVVSQPQVYSIWKNGFRWKYLREN